MPQANYQFGKALAAPNSQSDQVLLEKLLPKIKFTCKDKQEGYYGDNEFCQVFHYCKVSTENSLI